MTALLWGLSWLPVLSQRQYAAVLAAAFVAALLALRRRGPVGLLAGLLTLGTGAFVVADVLLLDGGSLRVVHRAPAPPGPPPSSLTVIDFNVLHGYPRFAGQRQRAARTVAAIAALEPDVVVLQEAWRTRRHGDFVEQLAAALEMDSAFARANGKLRRLGFEEGEAVLSRFPIVAARRVPLAPRRPIFERRVALVCELDLGGETLAVVGTHLDHRRLETANAQAAELARHLRALPGAIVAGDLNAASGTPAVDALLALGYRDLLPGGIDHLLLPEGWTWRADEARWVLRPADADPALSDHPAILARLRRTQTRPGPRPLPEP